MWTVGDRVAVVVLSKRAEYFNGQIGLTILHMGSNNYVSVEDAEKIPEDGGLFVLERTIQKQSLHTPEWRLVTEDE